MKTYDDPYKDWKDEVWPPPVLTLVPACINCVYAYEDASECRRHVPTNDTNQETGQPEDWAQFVYVRRQDFCGDGLFVVGEIPTRRLVTWAEWYAEELAKQNGEVDG